MAEIRYDNRVAIVTGAGGGLGRAHALLLASRGAKVIVNDLGGSFTGEGADSTPAQKVVDEIKAAGGEATPNYDNVLEGEKIVQCAMDTYGKLDILVNNAGILRDVSFVKMTEDDWDMVFAVHVKGAFKVTHAAFPHMRNGEYGRIVMTTSAAGLYGNFGQANYSAAKLALVGFGQTLAIEGGKRNIKCNIIAPLAGSRMTETVPFLKDALPKLKPELVSPLVGYLVSEECPVSGATYEVGAGGFFRVKWLRSKGVLLPIKDGITPEKVADNWQAIDDVKDGNVIGSINESMMPMFGNLSTAD